MCFKLVSLSIRNILILCGAGAVKVAYVVVVVVLFKFHRLRAGVLTCVQVENDLSFFLCRLSWTALTGAQIERVNI